jgi:hypothetical protein
MIRPSCASPHGSNALVCAGQPRSPSFSRLPYETTAVAGVAFAAAILTTGIEQRNLAELVTLKGELKQRLKTYDKQFAKVHGRPPLHVDKERMRPVYNVYNRVRRCIKRKLVTKEQPLGVLSKAGQSVKTL